jgi:hypothetical protein
MRPEVETLLHRDGRASLPLARQVLIYLDPFALFKDASRGNVLVRQAALSYNRAMRWMLVAYLRRWLLIAAGSFLCMFLVPTAALAVGSCLAFVVALVTGAAWLLLGVSRNPH